MPELKLLGGVRNWTLAGYIACKHASNYAITSWADAAGIEVDPYSFLFISFIASECKN